MKFARLLNHLLLICLFCLPASFLHAAGGGGGISASTTTQQPQIDPVVEYKKGTKYLQEGNYKRAAKSFRKVLKVTRKDSTTNYALGLAYIGQEKYSKAKKSLLKAIKYNADMVEAIGRLGYVYTKLDKLEDAATQRELLLTKQAACGDCKKAGEITKALAVIDGASASVFDEHHFMNADTANLVYVNAVGYINRGNFNDALELLEQAAKIVGPHPDVLTYQGFANRKMGNKDQAYAFYQAALAVAPDHRGANEYLGEFFIETDNLPAAKAQLAKLNDICQFGCEEAEELNRWIIAAES